MREQAQSLIQQLSDCELEDEDAFDVFTTLQQQDPARYEAEVIPLLTGLKAIEHQHVSDLDDLDTLARILPQTVQISLDLDGVEAPELVPRLLTSRLLPSLVSLELYQHALVTPEARHLLRALPKHIRTLRLSECSIGSKGRAALFGGEPFASLTTLDLQGNNLHDEDIQALAQAPGLRQVESLNLSNNHIYSEGLRALLQSPHLLALRELRLDGNNITSDISEIPRASWFSDLTKLTLGKSILLQQELPTFFENLGPNRLHFLSFDEASFDGSALSALINTPHLCNLEALWLQDCGVHCEQAAVLAGARHLTSLKELVLHYNCVLDEGKAALRTSPHLPRGLRVEFGYAHHLIVRGP